MILVLNYAKVGSTAVNGAALAHLNEDVFHLHGLRPPMTSAVERLAQTPGWAEIAARVPPSAPAQARLDEASASGETITLLTGLREPVARSISLALELLGTLLADCDRHEPEATADAIIERLRELWRATEPPAHPAEHLVWLFVHAPLFWLEHEIEQPFGFDLREPPIDPVQGYRIDQRGDVRLLLYRQEDAPRAVEAGLAQLYPGVPVSVAPSNTAEQRGHGELSALLKAKLRLPREVLERIYANPWVAAAYSEAERARAVERWCEPADTRAPARDLSGPPATVLIAVRDREAMVVEQIESLQGQWRDDLELLVIDDGSLDGSYEAAKAAVAARPDMRAVFVRNARPKGMATLADLPALTDRQVILLADSDDVSLPGRLTKVLAPFRSDPACRLVSSNALLTSTSGAILGVMDAEFGDARFSDPVEAFGKPGDERWIGATMAFHRSLLTGFTLDYERCVSGWDTLVASRAVLGGSHHYLSEPLILWRQHAGNSHRVEGVGSSDSKAQERSAAMEIMMLTQRLRDLEQVRSRHEPQVWSRADAAARRLLVERLDRWTYLRAHRTTVTDAGPSPLPIAPPILTAVPGERLDFGVAGSFGRLVSRWNGVLPAEAAWNWMARRAVFVLRAPSARAIRLGVRAVEGQGAQRLAVEAGGGEWTEHVLDPQGMDVVSAPAVPDAEGLVRVHLHAPDAFRPSDAAPGNGDDRMLGVRLFWLETSD